MGLGRGAVSIHEPASWVFNRMVEAYGARPAYPSAMVEAIAGLVSGVDARVCDVGAGIGHLSIPLAARGFTVTAVEPALAMLQRLQLMASERGVRVEAVHAAAEALPCSDASFELVVIADALHFLNAPRSAVEISRVLTAQGALSIVTSELSDTPFMRGVVQAMEDAAPRRPRSTAQAITQLASLTRIALSVEQVFQDEIEVDEHALEQILRSISFIGPALNAERFAAFRERVMELEGPRVFSRTLRLHTGRRLR